MLRTGAPCESPSVFTVGPGLISEYGTLMNTPAQSSANSTRVEASIVAVRRGMDPTVRDGPGERPSGPVRTGSVRETLSEISRGARCGAGAGRDAPRRVGRRQTASEAEAASAFALTWSALP